MKSGEVQAVPGQGLALQQRRQQVPAGAAVQQGAERLMEQVAQRVQRAPQGIPRALPVARRVAKTVLQTAALITACAMPLSVDGHISNDQKVNVASSRADMT